MVFTKFFRLMKVTYRHKSIHGCQRQGFLKQAVQSSWGWTTGVKKKDLSILIAIVQCDDLPVSSQAKAETNLVLTAFVLLHSIINTKFSAYIGTVGPNFETRKHVVAQ